MTALLDAVAGVEYEGEEAPDASADDRLAFAAWQLLGNDQGFDLAGLPFVVELLGIRDLEGLLQRLVLIKYRRARQEGAFSAEGE